MGNGKKNNLMLEFFDYLFHKLLDTIFKMFAGNGNNYVFYILFEGKCLIDTIVKMLLEMEIIMFQK